MISRVLIRATLAMATTVMLGLCDGASSTLTLRVRLPNGQTKRITATPNDNIGAVQKRAGLNGRSTPVFLDAKCETAIAEDASVESLKLESGAMLFCAAATSTKTVDGPTTESPKQSDVFAARSRKTAQQSASTFEGLSAERAGLTATRQKDPNCTQVSLDSGMSQQLAAYLASPERGGGGDDEKKKKPRRVALLFGTSKPKAGGLAGSGPSKQLKGGLLKGAEGYETTVEALWEPPQPGATFEAYDSVSLERAIKGCPALSVAKGLGLSLVGWAFSHPPRDHFLSAKDILLTASLRRSVEKTEGKAAAAALVVVAVRDATMGPAAGTNANADSTKASAKKKSPPPSGTSGAVGGASSQEGVTFEAYQISNQAYAWALDGTMKGFPPLQSSPPPKGGDGHAAAVGDIADAEATTVTMSRVVVAEGKEVNRVDGALFAVPVPIVTHGGGPLATRFPPANRPERRASTRLLSRAVFGEESSRSGGGEASPAPAQVLKNLCDFHLLLFLHKRLPADVLSPLLDLVRRQGALALTAPPLELPLYFVTVLEQLCGIGGSES